MFYAKQNSSFRNSKTKKQTTHQRQLPSETMTSHGSSSEKKGLQLYMDMLHKELHKENQLTQYLAQAEAKTGVNRLHIVMAGGVLFTLIFLLCFGGEFLMALISFVYPAYKYVLPLLVIETTEECSFPKLHVVEVE